MNTQQLKELALIWSRSEVACMPIEEFSDLTGTPLEDVRVLFGAANVLDDLIDQLESAERERDELRAEQAEHDEQIARMESKFSLAKRALDSKTARCEKAETELRRRDAEAGEPYGYVHKSLYEAVGSAGLSNDHEAYRDSPAHIALYTAAPPAVLPPKYADELTVRAELIEAYSKTQCEIAQELGCDSDNESILKAICEIKELGAQQQKVVELPDPVKWPEIPFKYFSEEQVFSMLDAAGVKWEVKK